MLLALMNPTLLVGSCSNRLDQNTRLDKIIMIISLCTREPPACGNRPRATFITTLKVLAMSNNNTIEGKSGTGFRETTIGTSVGEDARLWAQLMLVDLPTYWIGSLAIIAANRARHQREHGAR